MSGLPTPVDPSDPRAGLADVTGQWTEMHNRCHDLVAELRGARSAAATRPAGDDTAPPAELVPGHAATAALADAIHDAECECQDRVQHEAKTGTSYWELARTVWRQGWRPAAAGPRADDGMVVGEWPAPPTGWTVSMEDLVPDDDGSAGDDPAPRGPRHGAGEGFPRVAGRCPACRGASLFLAAGEHVTCSRLDCSDPCAADDYLGRTVEQIAAAGPRAGDTAPDDETPEQFRDRMLALLDAAGAATRCGNRLHWYLNGPEHRIAHALEIVRSEAAALRAAGDELAEAANNLLANPDRDGSPDQRWLLQRSMTAWRSAAGSPTTAPTAHRPDRDGDVAAWLRQHREHHDFTAGNGVNAYTAIDDVLDDYRLHADTGTPLTESAETGSGDETCGCGRRDGDTT